MFIQAASVFLLTACHVCATQNKNLTAETTCTGSGADAPVNGTSIKTSGDRHDSRAIFSCKPGFALKGTSHIICAAPNGDEPWPTPDVTCVYTGAGAMRDVLAFLCVTSVLTIFNDTFFVVDLPCPPTLLIVYRYCLLQCTYATPHTFDTNGKTWSTSTPTKALIRSVSVLICRIVRKGRNGRTWWWRDRGNQLSLAM